MNLYEAIQVRQSVRAFQQRPIEQSALDNIFRFKDEITPIYPDVLYNIECVETLEDSWGKRSGLFSVKAPYYLSYLSEEGKGHYLNAGYIMELLSLYLSAKGIGSCFLGGLKVIEEPEEGMKEQIVLSFGYPVHYPHRVEGTAKRMPLNKICVFKEEPNENITFILKAAALAPSSLNNQPWRFVVYNNRIHVFLKRSNVASLVLNRWQEVDVGCALAHIMVAAEEQWMDIEFKEIPSISEQFFKSYEYIISILIK